MHTNSVAALAVALALVVGPMSVLGAVYGPDASSQHYRATTYPATFTSIAGLAGAAVVPGTCLWMYAGCTTLGGLVDDEYSSQCISVTGFELYGTSVPCVWVNSNGYVAYSPTGTASQQATPTALPAAVPVMVAGFWADLVPCAGSILYWHDGYGRLTIEWLNVQMVGPSKFPPTCTGETLSFQVKLDGQQDMVTTTLGHADTTSNTGSAGVSITYASPATVGLQAPGGSHFVEVGHGRLVYDSLGVRYASNFAPWAYLYPESYFSGGWTTPLEDQRTRYVLLAFDAEGDAVSLVSAGPPARGTLTQVTTTVSPAWSGYQIAATFRYDPDPNDSGTFAVPITVTDALGATTSTTSWIYVYGVNDAPTIDGAHDVSVKKDAGPQDIAWATITPGPLEGTDNPNGWYAQTVTVTTANDNSALFATQPAVSADGQLTFESAASVKGTALVTVTVKDNGWTAYGGIDTTVATFTIDVGHGN